MNPSQPRIGIFVFTFIITTLFAIPPLRAAFEINKLGPKASAFNDAYSALGDDPWATLYNPAQIVRLPGTQSAFSYSRPYLNFGNFQANLISGFFTREALGTGYGLGVTFVDTNVFYREITGLFNLGHRFGEKDDLWDFSLGTNLKVFSLRRGDPSKPYDPALKPQTMNRFTADFGTHLRVQKFYLGISALNLIPANIGVVVKDVVPIETRVGIGAKNLWEIPALDFKVSPAVEISNRNHNTTASGGAQIQLFDFADFVVGGSLENISLGFSVFLNQMKNHRNDTERNRSSEKTARDSSEGTVYRLDVGYLYPINGIDHVGSPLAGMTFLF